MYRDAEDAVDDIIARVGKTIVLGLPLGLGKANHIANALFARAAADPTISLQIFTALTLEPPPLKSELEKRLLGPVFERTMGGSPPLAYARALRKHALPKNIEVNEFFFQAGRWLNNPQAQQHYISANYTHAVRYLIQRGVNVVAQLVAREGEGAGARYSLSCNTDITVDLLEAREKGEVDFLLTGQVNDELPFMPGAGDLSAAEFGGMLDTQETQFALFAPPKLPLTMADYALGLHIARLVPDGGTLQIGIGQEGDAAAQALILRHTHNAAFCDGIARLLPGITPRPCHDTPFETGLYAATEMFVDALLGLMDAGILKREVGGAVMHGAFFVGPRSFYRRLREMDPATRAKLQMSAVSFTNELYGDVAAKRAARVGARFINSAMMATLLGAVVSDGLEDGRVVSGVGGQYNFVEQAFALKDARSVIMLKSTRAKDGKTSSNIRWSYGHETIPRHLRDMVVSEYGVADLRGKPDNEVIAAMLSIADSRFQPELLATAKKAGKIAGDYEIPPAYRNNTPDRLATALAPLEQHGLLPRFPFGSDFDAVEQRLIDALQAAQGASTSPLKLARFALRGFFGGGDDEAALTRMGLERPRGLKEKFYRALVRAGLEHTQQEHNPKGSTP